MLINKNETELLHSLFKVIRLKSDTNISNRDKEAKIDQILSYLKIINMMNVYIFFLRYLNDGQFPFHKRKCILFTFRMESNIKKMHFCHFILLM